MAAVGQTEGKPAERTLFGHPVGLVNLFGVELWERFSFYGMLTILGYYLYYSVTVLLGDRRRPRAAEGRWGACTSQALLSAWLSRDLTETEIAHKQGEHRKRIARMRV
jgi:dipeptide/tripeptide permease